MSLYRFQACIALRLQGGYSGILLTVDCIYALVDLLCDEEKDLLQERIDLLDKEAEQVNQYYDQLIAQTENKELKQCLKQMRNECEMSQEKLYQVAREKSYYVPAAKASQGSAIRVP